MRSGLLLVGVLALGACDAVDDRVLSLSTLDVHYGCGDLELGAVNEGRARRLRLVIDDGLLNRVERGPVHREYEIEDDERVRAVLHEGTNVDGGECGRPADERDACASETAISGTVIVNAAMDDTSGLPTADVRIEDARFERTLDGCTNGIGSLGPTSRFSRLDSFTFEPTVIGWEP